MRAVSALIIVALVSSAAGQDADENEKNNVEPKSSLRLDPFIRKALLKALSDLEADDSTTDVETGDTTTDELLKTGDDITEISPTTSSKNDVQYHSYVVDGRHAFSNMSTFNPTLLQENIVITTTVGNVENQVTGVLPTPDPFNEFIQTKESNNLQQVRSIQNSQNANFDQDQEAKKITKEKTTTTTLPPTPTTTTTPKPTHNNDGENIEEVRNKDVQVFQAPLVAAFTVHQDALGQPRKVVPIFQQQQLQQQQSQQQQLQQQQSQQQQLQQQQSQQQQLQQQQSQQQQLQQQQSQQQPLQQQQLQHLQLQKQQLQQQKLQQQQSGTTVTTPSNIFSTPQRPPQNDFFAQQLALQQQLEQKQRVLEEQLRLLQLQQKQQEDLLRSQQLALQQKEAQRQQLLHQEELKKQQILQERQRLHQQNLNQITEFQKQQSFQNQFRNQNNFQQGQNLVSVQPSVSFDASNTITNQQLPNREAVDFLLHLRNQQPEQFPLQQNHLPQGITSLQLPQVIGNFQPQQNFQQAQATANFQQQGVGIFQQQQSGNFQNQGTGNFQQQPGIGFQQQLPIQNNFVPNQNFRHGNRVFRQESGTANFGFNNNANQFRSNGFQPINQNRFFGQRPTFNNLQTSDAELQQLLLQSGLNGRSQEDINIVSKVLALNHGIAPNNLVSNRLTFPFGDSRRRTRKAPQRST